MTKHIAATVLLTLCTGPAFAGGTHDEMAALPRESGLTARQYRMLAGPSTSYAEYRTSYSQLRHQLQRAAAREARELEAADAADAVLESRTIEAEAETYALPEER